MANGPGDWFVFHKHRKNCECCHHHSLFKGHKVIVNNVVLNCQQCNQCLKCQVSGHKISKNLTSIVDEFFYWKISDIGNFSDFLKIL